MHQSVTANRLDTSNRGCTKPGTLHSLHTVYSPSMLGKSERPAAIPLRV